MDSGEYKTRVLTLFRSGEATPGQWDELATLVLYASEGDNAETELIDTSILGPSVLCSHCESVFYPSEGACPCGAQAVPASDRRS